MLFDFHAKLAEAVKQMQTRMMPFDYGKLAEAVEQMQTRMMPFDYGKLAEAVEQMQARTMPFDYGKLAEAVEQMQARTMPFDYGKLAEAVEQMQARTMPFDYGKLAEAVKQMQTRMMPFDYAKLAEAVKQMQTRMMPFDHAKLAEAVKQMQTRMMPFDYGKLAEAVEQMQARTMPFDYGKLAEAVEQMQARTMPFDYGKLAEAVKQMQTRMMPTTHFTEISALAPSFDKINWASLEQALGDAVEATDAEVVLTPEEVEQALADMPWQRPDFVDLDLANQLNRLIGALQKQTAFAKEQAASGKRIGRKDIKLSVLQAVIKFMVEHLLLWLALLLIGLFSASKPTTVVHEVRTIIREVPALREEAKNYRIVGKGNVIACQRPKPKSGRVGRLMPGAIVRLVEKQKEWCLVEWQDAAGNNVRGWVKSKRLNRI